MIRKVVGITLSMLFSAIAIVFALPTLFAATFTNLAGHIYCWGKGEHLYDSLQTLFGIRLEDMRCMRCNKVISSHEKIIVADEILKLNLKADLFNQQIATEKIIEETKKNRDSSQEV